MSASPVVAVLGVGKLGEALVSGLLRAGQPADRLLGAERHPERAKEIAERYGVRLVNEPVLVGCALPEPVA